MLERELAELRVEWPHTPDLAGAVAGRLTRGPRGRPLVGRPAWQLAVAVVAALIAIVMAVPPARSAVLEWLGFESVRIERREPDAVYVAPDPAAGTRVDFVYAPREGLPRAQIAGVGC